MSKHAENCLCVVCITVRHAEWMIDNANRLPVVFVIAGSHTEFIHWWNHHNETPGKTYPRQYIRYVSDEVVLRGFESGGMELVFTGNWLSRPDIEQIERNLRFCGFSQKEIDKAEGYL